MDRPQTGAMMERPKTRWSRESTDGPLIRDDSPVTIRASSKMERPQSRRGIKIEMQDNKDPSQRPLSTTVFSSRRTSALGTRLNSAARINTGYVINNQRAFDRPVTGIRPDSTRGFPRLSRLVQDKRYYEGIIQLKIRELTQEIDIIKRGIERQNKEKTTFVHFDRRAKELAGEFEDLQGQLADYNTVLDKMTSNTEKADIEQAANKLAAMNERTELQIEEIFEQRQKAELKLRSLQSEIEQEKKNAEKIINSMDSVTRAKYDELYNQKMVLKNEIDSIQQEVDLLVSEKNKLEEGIALSQIKQEALKLHTKIMEIESKRNRLLEESQNKLSPENEKNKLLEKVKQDNVEITAAENRMSEIKKRTAVAEQELEQLEKDLEDNYSEKGARYKEFHKKEQIMEEFLSSFDENKLEELEKLKKLEKTIVDRLEKISNKMGGSYLNDDDIFDMKIDEDVTPKNLKDLKQQYSILQHNFLKMKSLETRFKTEMKELKEKINKKEEDLKNLDDFYKPDGSTEMSQDELTAEKEKLEIQEKNCSSELEEVEKDLNEIQKRLDANEIYGQISVLEQKLETLKQNNEQIENYVKNHRERLDYSSLKAKVNKLISEQNTNLKNINCKK